MLIDINNRCVSTEVEVPIILKGLYTIYGKNLAKVLKNSFSIEKIDSFISDQYLFRELVRFHQNAIKCHLERKYSIRRATNGEHRPLSLFCENGNF